MSKKYRVLVIDDSAFVRQFIAEILDKTGEFQVVATTGDSLRALELLKKVTIDVVTLDIDMPKIDGLNFLENLTALYSVPVVLINSRTERTSQVVTEALQLGACELIMKPTLGVKEGMALLENEIVKKVLAAAKTMSAPSVIREKTGQLGVVNNIASHKRDKIITIGASTGGTIALVKIFKELKPDLPGIIVIQHMPARFTEDFARTLDQTSQLQVKEAVDGDELLAGKVLVVPGGKSLTVHNKGSHYTVKVGPPDPTSIYNPSIDCTLSSVATVAGANSMGVILTGMGNDGARGLRQMSAQGAYTIAQDKKSSVVYGMPQKAVEFGGVQKVVPVTEVAREINRWASL